jgi:hypothetical protein
MSLKKALYGSVRHPRVLVNSAPGHHLNFVLVKTFAICVRKNNLRSPHFSNALFNFAG